MTRPPSPPTVRLSFTIGPLGAAGSTRAPSETTERVTAAPTIPAPSAQLLRRGCSTARREGSTAGEGGAGGGGRGGSSSLLELRVPTRRAGRSGHPPPLAGGPGGAARNRALSDPHTVPPRFSVDPGGPAPSAGPAPRPRRRAGKPGGGTLVSPRRPPPPRPAPGARRRPKRIKKRTAHFTLFDTHFPCDSADLRTFLIRFGRRAYQKLLLSLRALTRTYQETDGSLDTF